AVDEVRGGRRDVLRDHVRHHLEMARRAEPLDARELTELRRDAGAVAPDERPAVALIEARDVAYDAQAEDVARSAREAHLAEGHSLLGGPAEGVDGGGDIPHAVPRRIFLAVVEGVEIAFHALRIHRELVPGAAIVVRIDHDLDAVGWRRDIAAA